MIAEKDLEYQPVEAERYELYAEPTYHFRLDRREFFKALGGGIVVLFTLPVPAEATLAPQERGESGGGGRRGGGGQQRGAPREIGAWLHIGEDSIVTVFTGKAEVGQDVRTSLAQAVAEELHTPVSSLRMVLGDTDLTPFDAGTFGSRSTPVMNPQLRRVAAAARAVLIELAAQKAGNGASPDSLTTENGKVRHAASGKEWTFGELAKGRKLTREIGEETPTTPPDRWRIAGTPVPKIDGRDVVTGKRRYTSDLKRPGMMHGKVLRPPAIGSTLVSVDTKVAEAIPGVVVVRDGDFVGVVAPTTQAAFQASAALKAEWKSEPSAVSHKSLYEHLKTNTEEGREGRGGPSRNGEGDIEAGLKAAKHTVKSTFNIAYIAHAPLETRAAVAEWGTDGRLTVWTGTQRPFGVKAELAAAFRLPEERIRVIQGETGSGYGGKHTGEAALEAARLAKAAGKPVRVMWSREEEFTHAYFRPAGVIDVTGGCTESGDLCAWEFHNYNSGQAGIRMSYAVPNQVIAFHPAKSPLRQGSYRALASTANTFARETVMDELAQKAGMDPLAFRLRNLKDERLRAVFVAAAEAFGWNKRKKTPGRGFGIGGGTEKGGFVAACCEVSVGKPDGAVKVERMTIAFECGAIVNPDGLANQVEGAVLMGIGGALFEQIEFSDGKVESSRFSRYRVPRFSDTPKIEFVPVNRKDLPSAGAGEAPIIAVAPAIGSAIFDATGVRLRSLPLAPDGVKA